MSRAAFGAVTYRADIDGLRSLAILPVVFYHLQVSFTPGGFVGVDIFFVISGYLITSLISKEIDAGTYSIVDFYNRRARRIFPALFFLFACCIGAALAFLLPHEVDSFQESLIPAVLFYSNIHFYQTTNYFAQIGSINLLLHTWSLAVEEQFYIFFPLLLLAVRRLSRRAEKPIFIALALLSLAASVWLMETSRVAAFYLLQSRAWELLIGSLLAIDAVPRLRNRFLAEAAGGLGIFLICFSVATYSGKTPFPGLTALVPCLGAALVIQSGRDTDTGTIAPTWTSRLLSVWPLRFLGLISYSLYLWHWPIDVFAELFMPEKYGKLEKGILLALSITCAILSWHVIERPFRHRPFYLSRYQVLGLSGTIMACFIGIAIVSPLVSSLRWNLPPDVQRVLAVRNPDAPDRGAAAGHTCFLHATRDRFDSYDQENCLKIVSDKSNFLLIGDSHAAHLWIGLAKVFQDVNFMEAAATGCKPVVTTWGDDRCVALMHFIFDDYLPQHHIDAILLSSRWKDYDLGDIEATAARLKPYASHVIVMGPTVEYKNAAPRLLAMSMLERDPTILARNRKVEQRDTDRLFAAKLPGTGIDYISLYRIICPGDACLIADDDGLPIQFDYGHFTQSGSIEVARRFKAAGALPTGDSGPAAPQTGTPEAGTPHLANPAPSLP